VIQNPGVEVLKRAGLVVLEARLDRHLLIERELARVHARAPPS